MGQGEDDVEIMRRQEALHASRQPGRLRQALALGTVAIAAGVIRRLAIAAGCTHLEVTAQDFRPAVLNRPHRCALLRPQRVTLAVGGAMRAEDLGHLEARASRRGGRTCGCIARSPACSERSCEYARDPGAAG